MELRILTVDEDDIVAFQDQVNTILKQLKNKTQSIEFKITTVGECDWFYAFIKFTPNEDV